MSFQTPITIAQAIENIKTNKYLLPSIQREFVWKHQQIEWLFDSIMRGYPISSFLFWKVKGDTKKKFKFYTFIKEFRERYKTHNEEFSTAGCNDFDAILDGQQRLTSLYIGLCGSYSYKKYRSRDENTERYYPTRKLCLNVTKKLQDEEDGRIYEFKFLTEDEYLKSNEEWIKWVEVSGIYRLPDFYEFGEYTEELKVEEKKIAKKMLAQLHGVIHSKAMINYFLEESQEIDKALNIFIRINSGGKPLDFSDLIMSIAVANWEQKDARREIHSLVGAMLDKGFDISKDFILKCFLYLYSKDIKFKVSNFSKSNAKEFEEKWNDIRDAILSAIDLVISFGFVDSTLTSKNALLPIIYYIYHRGIYKDFSNSKKYEKDRAEIKKWLHTCLVKSLLGRSSSDTVLSQMRRGFAEDVLKQPVQKELIIFPAENINKRLGQEVTGVSDEFLEQLLYTLKENKNTFSLLALLYPQLDYKNHNFHKDHLHPASKCEEKYAAEIYNSILNLQLLDESENTSKSDKSLEKWVAKQTQNKDRALFLQNHLIPDVDLNLDNFEEFIDKRKDMLIEKLKILLK